MDVVASWTGERADLLRQALRMTNEAFAEHLGVAVRTVAYWRRRPDIVPRPAMQEILDTALARASEPVRAQFRLLLAEREHGHASIAAAAGSPAPEDAATITGWLTATGTSDEAISVIGRASAALAEAHTQLAPGIVMADVRKLQLATQALLRNGKPRYSQARELLRINGALLAHLSLLLSDRNDYQAADEYGNAALLYQREAGTSEVTAWYVLAKSARWQHRYAQAADLARQGRQHSSLDPMRVQLASYEANASALRGDSARARKAMTQAEEAAAALPAGQLTLSPWSFPEERMTIFRLSVALATHDPQGALQAAAATTADWQSGPHVPAAWAQIRVGAGIAHLLQDELDGAAEEVTPDAGTAARIPDSDRHRLARGPGPAAVCKALREQPDSGGPAAADPRLQPCPAKGPGHEAGQVNAVPAEMIDRWQERAEPAPGEGLIYWHMLLGDHPDVVAMARGAQQRLAPFTGLHMTPLKWLHMTALIAGSADEITGPELERMADAASRQLAETPPITVTLGKVLYHPEAIMLAAKPRGGLVPVLEAARSATYEVTGTYGRPGNRSPWAPHITVCYSTARQPAEPIVSALGPELPGRAVQISAVSLVIQRGPERLWDWNPVATIRFGAAHAPTGSDQSYG